MLYLLRGRGRRIGVHQRRQLRWNNDTTLVLWRDSSIRVFAHATDCLLHEPLHYKRKTLMIVCEASSPDAQRLITRRSAAATSRDHRLEAMFGDEGMAVWIHLQ